MAFDRTSNKLERVGGGGVHNIWHYNTPDAIATVIGSGYFNAMGGSGTNELRQYDVIHVIGSTGGTVTYDTVIVTSATGATTVTTSATEGVTAT